MECIRICCLRISIIQFYHLVNTIPKEKIIPIRLNPPDRNLEELLITIFVSRDGYRKHNLTDAIGEFISDNAGLLAYWGFVDYEINPTIEIDKNGSGDPHVNPLGCFEYRAKS